MDKRAVEFARRCSRAIKVRPLWLDAEDAFHDCVVQYLELEPKYKAECGVEKDAWLYRRIVSNVTKLYARLMREQAPCEADGVEPDLTPDARLDAQAIRSLLRLTREQEAVLKLKHQDGMTFEQMSDILGKSAFSLWRVYNDAREKVHAYYEKGDLPADPVQRV